MTLLNYENVPHCLFSVPKNHIRVVVEITERCNLNCKHCCVAATSYGEDISPEKILKIVDTLNAKEIYLTGGEPLLYSNLEFLLSELKKREIFVSMATNGTLLEKFMKIYRYVDRIQVSIDGLPPEHNKLRNITFDTVVSFCKTVKKIGIPLRISFTIWNRKMANEEYLFQYFKMLKDDINPDEVIVNVVLPSGRGKGLEWEELIFKELEIKRKAKEIGKMFGLVIKIHRYEKFSELLRCPGGTRIFFVNKKGIFPCSWIAKLIPNYPGVEDPMEVMKIFQEKVFASFPQEFSGCPAIALIYNKMKGIIKDPLYLPEKNK